MNPLKTTTRMSDEQIIAQFVEHLHEEYIKTEVEPTFDAMNRIDDTLPDQSNTQIVAAWDGESRLTDAEFVRVSYRDLQASGFSFWMGHPPTTPFFVVVFETNGERTFIKARVTDARPDRTAGKTLFLVTTEFNGRVEREFMPSLAAIK